MKTEDLLRVVTKYFKHPRGFFINQYEYSVSAGYAYEGVTIRAYDREHDLFFSITIDPPAIDDAARGRKSFGDTYGKAIGKLRDTIVEHETYYTRGYW